MAQLFCVQAARVGSAIINAQIVRAQPPDDPDTVWISIPEALYKSVVEAGLRWPNGGGLRWWYDGITISEVPDARPTVRLTLQGLPAGVSVQIDATGNRFVEVPLNAPGVTLLIEALNAQGNVATGFNAARRIRVVDRLRGDRSVRCQFASGVCTKPVPTGVSREFRVTPSPEYRIDSMLTVRVDDEDF